MAIIFFFLPLRVIYEQRFHEAHPWTPRRRRRRTTAAAAPAGGGTATAGERSPSDGSDQKEKEKEEEGKASCVIVCRPLLVWQVEAGEKEERERHLIYGCFPPPPPPPPPLPSLPL